MKRRDFMANLLGIGIALTVAPRLVVDAFPDSPIHYMAIDPAIDPPPVIVIKYIGAENMGIVHMTEAGELTFKPEQQSSGKPFTDEEWKTFQESFNALP